MIILLRGLISSSFLSLSTFQSLFDIQHLLFFFYFWFFFFKLIVIVKFYSTGIIWCWKGKCYMVFFTTNVSFLNTLHLVNFDVCSGENGDECLCILYYLFAGCVLISQQLLLNSDKNIIEMILHLNFIYNDFGWDWSYGKASKWFCYCYGWRDCKFPYLFLLVYSQLWTSSYG
jgi:hypothetical protein